MLLALCAKRIFTGMNRSREKLLLAAILLLIFYIATFVTYHPFRYKEFRLISPVVYSLDAIFLIELFKTVKNLLYRQLGPE